MKRSAFTMVELVFVIVILGILASIAVPRLAASRDDAKIAKGKADIAAIRSSIVLKRSQNLLAGNATFPDLNATAFSNSSTKLFDGILDYPVENDKSGWKSTSNDGKKYSFAVANTVVNFEYDQTRGIFTCVDITANSNDAQKNLCQQLTQ
ncbi:MAG: prepilin-type N-terminal cleavage/methylation domain-containing protein [Campylobacteraceae bacterium]|jgi:general secretion pathway protein G|nr:prepilin-type N-terminal cleavage/methylation domain-containing protein [Campylobacteraceae bacterium]